MNTQTTFLPRLERPALRRPAEVALTSALLALFGFLALELFLSLEWRLGHDTAHLHYIAWLIDTRGAAPYRDVFETSMPLAMLFHLAIGKTLGYGDLAFRLVDIGWFLLLSLATVRLLAPFGRKVGAAAPVVFGLVYLSYGPIMSLQRDYLAILPVVAALLASRTVQRPWLRGLVIGLLFGLAASWKPQFIIGLPVVLLYSLGATPAASGAAVGECRTRLFAQWVGHAAVALLGVLLAVSLPALWVWSRGGWADWQTMLSGYLPLYVQMNGAHKVLIGADRLLYLHQSLQELGGRATLLIPAVLGVYLAVFESRLSRPAIRLTGALAALALLYGLYPALSGQFWSYHWMPFIYFGVVCASLVLVRPVGERARERRLFALGVFGLFVLLVVRPAPDFFRQLGGELPRSPKDGRVDEMAAFLRHELRAGDTVQALDWVDGGTGQAMLLAQAPSATRFLYVAQFYHHVSTATVQGLRQEFLDELRAAPPRFIIDVTMRPRPSGFGTVEDFPELDNFVRRDYVAAFQGDGYVIYERAR